MISSLKDENIFVKNNFYQKYYIRINVLLILIMGIGDWGLGIGDWGLGIGPNPQSPSPIPNPQSPIPNIFS